MEDLFVWKKEGVSDLLSRDPFRVSRNDPCPCFSGKKWKKCCENFKFGEGPPSLNFAKEFFNALQKFRENPSFQKFLTGSRLESRIPILEPHLPPLTGEKILMAHTLLDFKPLGERETPYEKFNQTASLDLKKALENSFFAPWTLFQGDGGSVSLSLFWPGPSFKREPIFFPPFQQREYENLFGTIFFSRIAILENSSGKKEVFHLGPVLIPNQTLIWKVREMLRPGGGNETGFHPLQKQFFQDVETAPIFFKKFPLIFPILMVQFEKISLNKISFYNVEKEGEFNPSRLDLTIDTQHEALLDLPPILFNKMEKPGGIWIDLIAESPLLPGEEYTLAHWYVHQGGSTLSAMSKERVFQACNLLNSFGFSLEENWEMNIAPLSPEEYSSHMAVNPSSPRENLGEFFSI